MAISDSEILAGLERFQISAVSHGSTDLLQHLKGTAAILRRWSCPEELARAGFCHSIYGTESFLKQPATLDNRVFVRDLIGVKAERNAYLFGAHKKESLWTNLDREDGFRLTDRFEASEVSLSREDLRDLITLTLANWLEQRPRAGERNQMLRKEEFSRAKEYLPPQAYEEFLAAYGLKEES